MRKRTLARAAAGAMLGIAPLLAGCTTEKAMSAAAEMAAPNLDQIQNVVVIFAENRSFDNLYGSFPAPTAWPMRARRAWSRSIATAPSSTSCRRSGRGSRPKA